MTKEEATRNMYGSGISATALGAGTVGTLAYTGSQSVWYAAAGVTLVAVGFALTRLVPRRQK